MEAKHLMIGDWLSYDGEPCQFIYSRKVGRICFQMNPHLKIDVPETDLLLKPILLTPEILEKNEFHFGFTSNEEDMAYAVGSSLRKEDEGWVWDEGNGAIKVIFPNESDGGEVKLEGTNYLAYVFDEIYVHQLQQLIRLSGIDKEITLT